ncbi:hypothetical protein AAG565_06370 [Fontimonas sp. SYSU GA230001]|uniref:hypothetical protein n=1 Tax=Fontimonas sp. SYSU GA230001 TaxID=3142450 RepID=UPI0032B4F4EC
MHNLRTRRLLSLLALWAALAQLWLGTLHARMGSGTFCGDGSTGRSAALLRQLPPELRLPLDRLDRAAQPECTQCALGCSVAVPPPAAARLPVIPVASVPRPPTAPADVPVRGVLLPPSRGPPATR